MGVVLGGSRAVPVPQTLISSMGLLWSPADNPLGPMERLFFMAQTERAWEFPMVGIFLSGCGWRESRPLLEGQGILYCKKSKESDCVIPHHPNPLQEKGSRWHIGQNFGYQSCRGV